MSLRKLFVLALFLQALTPFHSSRAAFAAPFYFDVNGTTGGSGVINGGSYNWNTGTANWANNNNTGTVATVVWANGNDAVFVATSDAGTNAFNVNVGGANINFNNITVNSGNPTFSGAVTNFFFLNSGSVTAAAGSTVTFNETGGNQFNLNGKTVTFAGGGDIVFGASTGPENSGNIIVNMSGNGSLTLNGTGAYTGTTTVSGGTLVVANTAALGTNLALSLNGGNLQLATDSAVNSKNVTLGGNATVILDRATSGAGFNTTFGNLTSNSGARTFTVTKGANVTDAASLTFNGTLSLSQAAANVNTFDIGADVTVFLSGSTATGAQTISLAKSGAGKLVLNGSYGTWDAGNAIALNGGTLELQSIPGDSGTFRNITAAGGTTLSVVKDVATDFRSGLTVNGNMNLTSGRTSAGGGVTHTLGTLAIGASTLTVAADASATSGTQGGTFSGNTTLSGSATINTNNGPSANTLLTLAAVTGTNQNLNIGGTGNTTIGGNISLGSGTLTKNDAGTLRVNGSYSGGTATVNGGTLALGGTGDSFNPSSKQIVINNGGTVQYVAANVAQNNVLYTINGGGTLDMNGFSDAIGQLSGAGNISIGGGLTLDGYSNPSTQTFSGIISGGGGLTLRNITGTQILSGSNSYSGGTFVNSGTLQVNSDAALGSTSALNPVTLNGGRLTSGAANIALDANHAIIVNAGGGTINAGVNGSVNFIMNSADMLQGSGTLTVTGGSATTTVLRVNAAQPNMSGNINITSGRINVNDPAGTLGTGTITVGTGSASLYLSQPATLANDIQIQSNGGEGRGAIRFQLGGTVNGDIVLLNNAGLSSETNANDVNLNGNISGAFSLQLGGLTGSNAGATYNLAGANTVSGLNVSSGTVNIDGSQTGGGSFTVKNGSTVNINGTATVSAGGQFIIGQDTAGTATVNVYGTLNLNSATDTLIGQNTSSPTGNLTIKNGGIVNVTNGGFRVANAAAGQSPTGIVTLEAGSQLNLDALATSTAFVLANGSVNAVGTVNLNGGVLTTARNITDGGGNATFNFNGGTLRAGFSSATFLQGLNSAPVNSTSTIDTQAFDITIAQALTTGSGGGLVKEGTGDLTFTAANSYSGGTQIKSGRLRLTGSGTFGSGAVTVDSGAEAFITTGATHNNTFNISGDGGTLSSVDPELRGAIRLEGSTIGAGGAVVLQANSSLGSYNGNTGTVNAVISESGGARALSINKSSTASPGTIVLGAANTFSGDTRIYNGTLQLNNVLALQNSTLDMNGADAGALSFGTLTSATFGGLKGSRNLSLDNTTPAAVALTVGNNNQSTTYSGILSGSGSLTKIGTGALTLTNANTYGGATTVQGGTLQLDAGGKVSNTSSITVGNSSGNGTLLVTTTGPHQMGTGELVLGSTGGSIGTFNLQASGGTVSLVDSLVVGDAGVGIVNHASGVLNIGNGDPTDASGDLILGRSAGAASSSYDLVGGSVTADNVYIGQSGGTSGSPHLMSVGPGTTLTSRRDLVVGAGGYGRLAQNGGTVNVQGVPTAIIGDGSTGTYDLDGGGLLAIAGNAEVGTNGGNGTMNHNDGTVTVGQNLTVGDAGSTGVYNLANNAANSLTVTGSEFIGVSDGVGTFTQSGGTHVLNGASSNLTLGASGQFNLAGGTLDFRDYVGAGAAWTPNNASTITTPTGGQFSFTGGNLYDVSTITVSNGSNFTQEGGNFYIGQDGTGPAALTTINGGFSLVNGVLHLDAFGVDATPEVCCDGIASLNDQLTVTGDATLDSVVNIDFVGFTPVFGDVFTLICANDIAIGDNFSLTGGYFRVVPTGLGPGQPQYALQAIVPEPASVAVWSLLGLVGGVGFWASRRKGRKAMRRGEARWTA